MRAESEDDKRKGEGGDVERDWVWSRSKGRRTEQKADEGKRRSRLRGEKETETGEENDGARPLYLRASWTGGLHTLCMVMTTVDGSESVGTRGRGQ